MKLVSWNVNGLRSCLTKGFLEYVKNEDPDILCLQETKLQPEQAVFDLAGAWSPAGRGPSSSRSRRCSIWRAITATFTPPIKKATPARRC